MIAPPPSVDNRPIVVRTKTRIITTTTRKCYLFVYLLFTPKSPLMKGQDTAPEGGHRHHDDDDE